MCHSITRTLCRVCEKQIGEPQIAQIPCLPPTAGSGSSGYNRDYRDIASASLQLQQDLDIAALARGSLLVRPQRRRRGEAGPGDHIGLHGQHSLRHSFDESRVKQFFREYGHVNDIDVQREEEAPREACRILLENCTRLFRYWPSTACLIAGPITVLGRPQFVQWADTMVPYYPNLAEDGVDRGELAIVRVEVLDSPWYRYWKRQGNTELGSYIKKGCKLEVSYEEKSLVIYTKERAQGGYPIQSKCEHGRTVVSTGGTWAEGRNAEDMGAALSTYM
ncbi:hypothetical protein B0T26DRAFT_784003 [Lasiosphaeria miniovina]|uniref:Uncharacterized protein n=1 Tax=Lasiosphaeria miniovina TaxID=1954250 RepID=A0AA40ADY3_9PEZI|nr:uncharacterized protein B0T26DRAFT_784003 [Lasiosphaeria miniovina]KAK0714075.1 hypothetical protein B0T26DRAFT_784003 [Lasiosphaeria miniovina]